MPNSKVTFFINAAVQNNSPATTGTAASAGATTRVGGISESYYSVLAWNSTELFSVANRYADLRARLLPNVCALVASRFQEVGSKGKCLLSERTNPGSADTIGDIPQMALRTKVHSRTTGAERKIVLGAIPDARVLRGSYNPSEVFQGNFSALMEFITTNFLMRAIDQTVATVAIESVTGAGLVTTLGAHGFAIGDKVQIMATRTNKWKAIGGVFKVKAITPPNAFTVDKWEGWLTTEGKVRKALYNFEQVQVYTSDVTNPKATTRKFGSPFDLFRGRASARQ